jgi:hypothetical protein
MVGMEKACCTAFRRNSEMRRICLSLLFLAFTQGVSPALTSLVEAERAFARTCVERGLRDSFLAFFADDGIGFQPNPINRRESLLKQPVPASRPPVTLNWAPIYGDIASSAELGYTTGPFLITDNSTEKRPARHGMFFSIWQKQTDGNWKVVLDIGIDTPEAVAALDAPFVPARVTGAQKKARSTVLEAEASESRYSADARKHRQKMMPLVGRDAISLWLKAQNASMKTKPIGWRIARSGDFGYAYGSYEFGAEKGFYARAWRVIDGTWNIVAEITNQAN